MPTIYGLPSDGSVPAQLVPATAAPLGNRWVFLGDSITAGSHQNSQNFAGNSFPLWVQLESGGRINMVRNAGVPGNTSAQMLARFDTDVTPYFPAVVFLMAGINDIGQGVSFEQYTDNVDSIRQQCQEIGAALVLSTILPNNEAARKPVITRWNLWLRTYAAAHGLHLVDSFEAMVDVPTGNYVAGTFSDATHPNNVGMRKLGKAIAERILPHVRHWQPMLVRDGGDTVVNLFGTNPLLTVDATGDGRADSWVNYGGTDGVGYVESLVTDPLVPGKMQQVELQGRADIRVMTRSPRAGTWKVGDKLYFAAVVTSNGGVECEVRLNFSGSTANLKKATAAKIDGAITRGVVSGEVVVPVGTTQVVYEVIASAGTGVVSFGQPTLINLTDLGLA